MAWALLQLALSHVRALRVEGVHNAQIDFAMTMSAAQRMGRILDLPCRLPACLIWYPVFGHYGPSRVTCRASSDAQAVHSSASSRECKQVSTPTRKSQTRPRDVQDVARVNSSWIRGSLCQSPEFSDTLRV